MNERPERLVLLGHPLGHSLSPVFQNAALRAAGIPLVYELLDIPRSVLDETLGTLRRKRAAGNVTTPHKEAVGAACDRRSDTATAVGAVNTFWTAVDGALVGDNTDVGGFEAAIRELIGAPRDKERVAILRRRAACGGTARNGTMEARALPVLSYAATRGGRVARFMFRRRIMRTAEDASRTRHWS